MGGRIKSVNNGYVIDGISNRYVIKLSADEEHNTMQYDSDDASVYGQLMANYNERRIQTMCQNQFDIVSREVVGNNLLLTLRRM
jgi:hypothetical protein